MKTIIEAINDRLDQRQLSKRIETSERTEATYREYPKLYELDSKLLEVRSSKLISSLEQDKEPIKALNKLEDELISQRTDFIKKNGINPNFDKPQIKCQKCSDTGFIKASDGRRVVCMTCMQAALEDAFEGSGLKDYSSYTLKAFKLDYFKDGGIRKRQFEGIKAVTAGDIGGKPLRVLNGKVQSGKTYLAVIATKYAILQGLSAYYVKADKLCDLPHEDLETLKSYDMVVIDDYSAEVTLGYKNAAALHDLLEARIASGRVTIMITTTRLDVLVANSDERIAGKLSLAAEL